MLNISTIGFGEAARAFVSGWASAGVIGSPIASYDIKIDDARSKDALMSAAHALGVESAPTLSIALAGRNAIFCLVTADRAHEAAGNAARAIERDTMFFDCNSCAPLTKARSADLIEAAGGRYVDVAVMSPVHPKLHRTPLLISGRHVDSAQQVLSALGMNSHVAGEEVGQASSIKMLRSVMIKGLEALTAECVLAARRAGVEPAVLASLQASDPRFNWGERCAYNLERMMVHGERRAAEMEEVAATLRDLGLPNRMTLAAVNWHRQIAALELPGGDAILEDRADRILENLRE